MDMNDWQLRLTLVRGFRSGTLAIGHIISKAIVDNLGLAEQIPSPYWPLIKTGAAPDKVMREIVHPMQNREQRRRLLRHIADQMARDLADRLDDLDGWNGKQRREDAEGAGR